MMTGLDLAGLSRGRARPAAPTPDAERQRRRRARRKEGAVVVRIVLHADGVADLVEAGWLRPQATPVETREALLQVMAATFEALPVCPVAAQNPGINAR